jgi:3-oxoacyl-[acyl-carrier protein] reductase
MSFTNKLFSLLGFTEPVYLKRFNGKNLLPENVLLLSTNDQISADIQQTLTQLPINIIEIDVHVSEKSIEALIIDATDYIDESCYQNLFLRVQSSLKLLSHNARVLVITNSTSSSQSVEQNAFSQALIGFSKSLAKEVGRKGSTANIILIDQEAATTNNNTSAALVSPMRFFLSAKSAFVSGQALTINDKNELMTKSSNNNDKQKVAVVTGAAQGIGSAIANKLSDEGYLVIGVDIEPMETQLINTMKALRGESFLLDVSTENAGEQLATLANKHGGFDLIVHNAGITRDKTLAKMPTHFWQKTLDINLLSVMRINKALIDEKSINSSGSIVCLSSMNGIAGQGGQTNYACSKAGIIGYVKSISAELTTNGIKINAVAPGFIETQMTDKMPFFTREMGRRMSALGQGGLPLDVAETVAFLGSTSSYGISGQTIRVCGLNIIGA